jgi:hypothetical protein
VTLFVYLIKLQQKTPIISGDIHAMAAMEPSGSSAQLSFFERNLPTGPTFSFSLVQQPKGCVAENW